MSKEPKGNKPKYNIGDRVAYLGVFNTVEGTIKAIYDDGDLDQHGYTIYRYTMDGGKDGVKYNEKRLKLLK